MKRSKRQEGMTLIEILLALIVMVVGIVGILALFPPALESAKISMEETNAAIVAESVAHALTNSVRLANFNPGTGIWTGVLVHDLNNEIVGTNQFVQYEFTLPNIDVNGDGTSNNNDWMHHPATGDPSPGQTPGGNIENDTAFKLKGDLWTYAGVESVRSRDKSDPYGQFAFSYDVRKINTLEYMLTGDSDPIMAGIQPWINPATGVAYTLADLEPLVKLYEFRIHIFRETDKGNTASAGVFDKNWVTTVRHRVSTK